MREDQGPLPLLPPPSPDGLRKEGRRVGDIKEKEGWWWPGGGGEIEKKTSQVGGKLRSMGAGQPPTFPLSFSPPHLDSPPFTK